MTTKQVLKIAKKTAGNRAEVSLHKGEGAARAVRISGTDERGVQPVGREIEEAFRAAGVPSPGYRYSAGFAAVWYR